MHHVSFILPRPLPLSSGLLNHIVDEIIVGFCICKHVPPHAPVEMVEIDVGNDYSDLNTHDDLSGVG